MNQTNQQPIQEPSFESKQNSNKLLLTIIISVLATLIIVGLAMYFVMAKVNNNNQENLQKQIQYLQQKIDVLENQEQVKIDNSDIDNVIDEVVQEKQGEQVDVFFDWKTYTNSEYRYEFKYPSNWYRVSDSSVISGLTAEFFGNTEPPHENSYFGMIGHDSGLLMNIIVSNQQQEYLKGDTLISENPINFNGIHAIKKISETIYPHMMPKGNKYIGIYFLKDNKNYSIEGELWWEDFEEYEIVFEQILSTFKFIN
ncbi:hypothetical protein KKA66_02590 [Patescibacteria group bacterium]|nr:hypothetical protein [Patescibacteria group bacterium]